MPRTAGQYADSLRAAVGAVPVQQDQPGVVSPSNPPVAQPNVAAPVPADVAQASTNTAPAKHPKYDAQDGEDPDTGHAHLMHDLGSAIQEMMKQDPQTHKSISDMFEQFMGKGVDYDSEAQRLRSLIESRQTPKAPNWITAGVGSWAGGPRVANEFAGQMQAASQGEQKKQEDLETTESKLLKEHTEDLRARGKTKEALLMGLLGKQMTEQGKDTRQSQVLQSRAELQDRSLGAAEERLRQTLAGRSDIADKTNAQKTVMGIYTHLLGQQETDKVSGGKKYLHSADEAMRMALAAAAPISKGTADVAAGKTPTVPAPAPGEKTTQGAHNKLAAWKAQNAVGGTPKKGN